MDSEPAQRPRRTLANAVIATWLLVQALACLRAALPLPRPWGGNLPWAMFNDPRRFADTVRAEGRTPAGEWVEIPVDAWFRYTRGATGEHLHHNSRVLGEPGHDAERAAFAAWLAAKMAEAGAPVLEVRLIRVRRDLERGRTRTRELGSWEVAP